MRYLRNILGRRTNWGSLMASWSCGIICGIVPLLEAEGLQEVDVALNEMFPDVEKRPVVLFYDKACEYHAYLANRGDDSWGGTLLIVDR